MTFEIKLFLQGKTNAQSNIFFYFNMKVYFKMCNIKKKKKYYIFTVSIRVICRIHSWLCCGYFD